MCAASSDILLEPFSLHELSSIVRPPPLASPPLGEPSGRAPIQHVPMRYNEIRYILVRKRRALLPIVAFNMLSMIQG